MKVRVLGLAGVLLVAACGGTGATTAPASVAATHGQATIPAPGHGPIDTEAIQAAVTALKAHQSWQFTLTMYESGTPNFSRTVTGTQRPTPTDAISLTVSQSGKPDQRYTRIGNDVWYDTGTGSYTTSKASDNYVSSQFQPYYLDGLVTSAEVSGYQYLPVGPETVSGVPTTHYRLAESIVQSVIANMPGITAADWAADVWIATADGSLIRLAWGPQSVDKAQLQTGFNYVVTSLDCACPVDPPA